MSADEEAVAREPDVAEGPGKRQIKLRWPLGHYYSPVPDIRELSAEAMRARIWPEHPPETPGIDWRDGAQLALCREVFSRLEPLEFPHQPTERPYDYYMDNDAYSALDATVLQAMLRHLRPRRMIEVGSGYSSMVSARVNRELLENSMHYTCIDPYPRPFMLEDVPGITERRREEVQSTPLALFEELGEHDVLFVDTSHTVKTGNDVQWIFGQILPRLRPGVLVHIHDVFLPRDYPVEWVMDGWGWNEQYLIQAFLTFNSAFEIVFGVQWMMLHHRDELKAAFSHLPVEQFRSGGSLWIRRIPEK